MKPLNRPIDAQHMKANKRRLPLVNLLRQNRDSKVDAKIGVWSRYVTNKTL